MRRYGESAMNPRGFKENPTKCVEEVWERSGWHSYQCRRLRGHGPDGLYCKQHAKQKEAHDRLFGQTK